MRFLILFTIYLSLISGFSVVPTNIVGAPRCSGQVISTTNIPKTLPAEHNHGLTKTGYYKLGDFDCNSPKNIRYSKTSLGMTPSTKVMALAALPLTELRGSIPYGLHQGLPVGRVVGLSVLGKCYPS